MQQETRQAGMGAAGPEPGRDQVLLVYVTAPTVDEAERMGRTLVEERLAACVNLIPGITSFYWWEDQVQREGEVLLLVKTQSRLLERLVTRVRELSGYEVPATSALPVVGGNPEYLRWVVQEARG